MSRSKQNPITSEKLKEVMDIYQANLGKAMPKPAGPPSLSPDPGEAAESDQDAGGGYNSNHVFPQQ
jgi:hypothetical protein